MCDRRLVAFYFPVRSPHCWVCFIVLTLLFCFFYFKFILGVYFCHVKVAVLIVEHVFWDKSTWVTTTWFPAQRHVGVYVESLRGDGGYWPCNYILNLHHMPNAVKIHSSSCLSPISDQVWAKHVPCQMLNLIGCRIFGVFPSPRAGVPTPMPIPCVEVNGRGGGNIQLRFTSLYAPQLPLLSCDISLLCSLVFTIIDCDGTGHHHRIRHAFFFKSKQLMKYGMQ